jgi:hypothetical protein
VYNSIEKGSHCSNYSALYSTTALFLSFLLCVYVYITVREITGFQDLNAVYTCLNWLNQMRYLSLCPLPPFNVPSDMLPADFHLRQYKVLPEHINQWCVCLPLKLDLFDLHFLTISRFWCSVAYKTNLELVSQRQLRPPLLVSHYDQI